MSPFLHCYLETHRRRWGLSQEELASLLGQRSSSAVSRCETLQRIPNLRIALQLELIFGVTPQDLFPALYRDAEDAVMRQAKTLHETLEGRTDAKSQEKLALLSLIIERAKGDTDYV